MELPKTEAELDALISSKVEEATKSLEGKHNSAMAKVRTDYETKIKDLKAENELGKEEYAKQKLQEQQEADANELKELRAFRKSTILGEKLAKEGLPSYFKNDTRLLNANDSDLDKAIKDVKKEYEATLPSGNQHSSVVQTQNGFKKVSTSSDNPERDEAYEKAADSLKDLFD